MKVLSIFLALVNTLMASLVLLSCISVSNLSWNGLSWTAVRVATGILVIMAGLLTFRDGAQSVNFEIMLMTGLMLVLLETSSAMWGVHLSIISGNFKNVMILFGSSLILQGIASIIGLGESGEVAV